MEPTTLLLGALIIGIAYLAVQSGALAQFGLASGPTVNTPTGETITGAPATAIAAGASALQIASAQGAQAQVSGKAATAQIQSSYIKTGLGTATAVGAAASTAAVTGASVATAAMTAGITAGIGAVVGIALALWSAHEARIAGAQREDNAWNDIMPGFISIMQGIVNAYNSGQIDKPTAAAEVLAAKQYTFAAAQKFVGTPGTDWVGGNTGNYNGQAVPIGLSTRQWWRATCDKHCTIGCCLWNGVIGPACNKALDIFTGSAPTAGQDVHIASTSSSSYGYAGTPQQDLYLTR